MTITDLRSNIHKVVDQIDDEQLLHVIYDFLKKRADSEDGQLWASLTEEQKIELILSYEESEDESKLIDKDKVIPSSEGA